MKTKLFLNMAVCVLVAMCGVVLAGCATSPKNIGSTHVSTAQYSGYSCEQIGAEMARVNRKIAEVSGKQVKAAKKDKVATGITVVTFNPLFLFFLSNNDNKEELKNLKGEYEALERLWIEKECG